MDRFMEFCHKENLQVKDIEMGKNKVPQDAGVFVIITLKSAKRLQRSDVVNKINRLEGLKHIEEL